MLQKDAHTEGKSIKKKKKEVKMPLRGRKEMKLGKGTQEAIKVKCIS